MFHLYLITDGEGSWPIVHNGPLTEGPVLQGTAVVALLGRFPERETALTALSLARTALCNGTLEREDADQESDRARGGPTFPTPPTRPRRKRRGRRPKQGASHAAPGADGHTSP